MSGFSAFAADLATHLSLETGWAWHLDGTALVLPVRGLALDLRPLWGLAQHGASAAQLTHGVLTALNAWDPAHDIDCLRVHIHVAPTAPEAAAFSLGHGLWLTLVLVLPLYTRAVTPQEVPHADDLVHEAIRNTVRAPDVVVPIYVGGPLARYRSPGAQDAAVAYGLLSEGAMVAALAADDALVLQATRRDGLASFQRFLARVHSQRLVPSPPIWIFRDGALQDVAPTR